MNLSLRESIDAYSFLLKQGKLLISEMTSSEIDNEDVSILKTFEYQYYYYYLFYYFNNLQRSHIGKLRVSERRRLTSSKDENIGDKWFKAEINDYHSLLMESVYLDQFSNLIPRDCSLAPIRLLLNSGTEYKGRPRKINFTFLWNMFDGLMSMKIFTEVICRDHYIPFEEKLVSEFEKQVVEASIVECDFALLVEMLSNNYNIKEDFKRKFLRILKIDVNLEISVGKIKEQVMWDLLNSDLEVSEVVKNLIKENGIEEDQMGIIMYYFKREIMTKKKEMVLDNSAGLCRYAQLNNLRTPFICRKEAKFVVDVGPFLVYQKQNYSSEIEDVLRSSYKERLQLLSVLAKI